MQCNVSYSLFHNSVHLHLHLSGELRKGHRVYRELNNEQGLLWVKINTTTVKDKAHIGTSTEVRCRLTNQTSNRMNIFSNIYLQEECQNCFPKSENSAGWFPITFCTMLEWQHRFRTPGIWSCICILLFNVSHTSLHFFPSALAHSVLKIHQTSSFTH